MGLGMVNLYTKVEVSSCTHYEAMNHSAKCRHCGGLLWLGHQGVYDFLFNFNIDYVSFSRYSEIFAESHHLNLAPSLGVILLEFR